MKSKIIKTLFLLTIAVCLIALLFACDQVSSTDAVLAGISVKNTHEGDYILGEDVDLTEVTVTASYSDGETRSFPLSDYMLTNEDKQKFFTKGVHTITVTYEEKTVVFQIKVVDPQEEVVFRARFFSNGGTDIATQYTDTIKQFLAPVREGYTFDGWYSSYDFSGSKAIAPYILKTNTDFYAKWVDNRRCNVKFYDGDEVLYEENIVYGGSIDIDDLSQYPAPSEKEGKIFTGWKLSSGSTVEMSTDTVIIASYESVRCTVQIEYWDDVESKIVNKPTTLNYGEYFDVSAYTMPTQEGHTSRWVVYRVADNFSVFSEFPENTTSIRVTEGLKIAAYHVINTYTISIYNGVEESKQRDADLKSGNIALEPIYYDAKSYSFYSVNYNASFIISNFTQEPYLKEPTVLGGYDAYWCFVITTLTGEVWRNANNYVWNESTQAFELLPGEEEKTIFDLYDRDGNYVAHVDHGDLYEVKGNVTVRAKYVKKTYSVKLSRLTGSNWEQFDEFTVKYRTDFKLYDPEMYTPGRFTTWQEVESYYLLHNVVGWSKDTDINDSWREIYFNGNNTDDYAIEWYTASGQSANSLVDFTEKNYYEIRDDLNLYCKDIDQRRYTVKLFYNYDFATGDYLSVHEYPEITESEAIEKPAGSEGSILRTYPDHNGFSITYVFEGWYDYPFVPDGNGMQGNRYSSLDTRTRNMCYYAHYKCDTTYTVTISDKTQSMAYDGTPYENKGYDVKNTIVYSVPAGTVFNMNMIYKGRNTVDGYVSGAYYYEEASFMDYVIVLPET